MNSSNHIGFTGGESMKAIMKLTLPVCMLCLCLGLASCSLFTDSNDTDSQNQSSAGESDYWLGDAYPNPMTVGGTTTFEYKVKDGSEVSLVITNTLEQEILNITSSQSGSITWNGKDKHGRVCGSGIYFYQLTLYNTALVRKLLIIQ